MSHPLDDRERLQREADALADSLGFPHVDILSEEGARAPQRFPTQAHEKRPGARVPPAPPSRATRLARARDAKRARAVARAARAERRDREWEQRNEDALEGAGWERSSGVKPASWRAGWASVSDHRGHSAQREYERFPAPARGMLRRAMAGRDFRNSRSRHIIALAAVLYRQSRMTLKRARRRLVVEYLSIDTLCATLHDKTSDHRPSRSAMSHAEHRPGGNVVNGQCGYKDALREVGFVHWLQERQEKAHPTVAQYWLIDVSSPYMNAGQREWLAELAREAFALEATAPRPPPAL